MLLAAALIAATQAEAASLPAGVPTPATVAAHVTDCIAATNRSGVDSQVLTGRGWSAGSIRASGRGAPRMAIFGKAGDLTMLSTIQGGPRGNECLVMSPVAEPAGIEAIRAALDLALVAARTSPTEAETAWATPGHRVRLVRIGNADVQGVRVTVTAAGR